MGVHGGHRARVRKRFQEEGLDGFAEHEVLELLLFFAIPQQDVNALAHKLLAEFGSLANVLHTPIAALANVPGMGESSATLLSLLPHVFRRYQISLQGNGDDLSSIEKAAEYLLPRFTGIRHEQVLALLLDARGRLIICKCVSEGTVNTTDITARKLVELAVRHNASNMVLAHNHPSGVAVPSSEDHATTLSLRDSLGELGIRLIDHIVVADGDYVSMAQSGLFTYR